jgi:hypothetical protein
LDPRFTAEDSGFLRVIKTWSRNPSAHVVRFCITLKKPAEYQRYILSAEFITILVRFILLCY